MPLPPLPESAITVGAHASDWREAVELAGEALVRSGATKPGCTATMRSSWTRIDTWVCGGLPVPSISRPAWITRSLAAAGAAAPSASAQSAAAAIIVVLKCIICPPTQGGK